MFKLIIMAKRKPGMSMDEFRDYYEKRHAPLALSVAPSRMRKYVRNFITPVQADPSAQKEAPYDCVTECWFDSEADFQRSAEVLATQSQIAATIAKDEENLFDRSTINFFTAVECESDLDVLSK
jgi:uncharacterized protein (TIGR02118 family)